MGSQTVLAEHYDVDRRDRRHAPIVRPNPPRYGEPGYGRPYPGPVRPGYPVYPIYPPIYRPLPPPVYPYPPSYPDRYVDKVIYINRYVSYETLQLFYLSELDEYYRGYNVTSIDVNTSGGTYATSVDLLVNGSLADTEASYGYVRLNTNYRSQIGYDVFSLDVRVNGQVYVGSITVHLSRY